MYSYGQICDDIINDHNIAFYCEDIRSVLWWEENVFGEYVALYKKEHIKFTDVYISIFTKSTKEECLKKN